jgi:CHAD domain-containing protein
MVADGKWIMGLVPEMPLLAAARHVLFVRMQVVRDYLPRVVHQADADIEHVHQLRVGTRRADAALRIFRSCMSDKVYRSSRARLRLIRRSAGAVRDLDVFLDELRARLNKSDPKDRSGVDFLTGYGVGQRKLLLEQLVLVCQDQQAEFEGFLTELIGVLRDPEEKNGWFALQTLARPMLADLRQTLEEKASADLTDYSRLHQVRIAGKRLRYAMEVFADCFPAKFREEVYPQVEEMQEILGRANDSHVTSERLGALRNWLKQHWGDDWNRLQPGIEGLLRYHQRRLPVERRRFLQWWERWSEKGSAELLTTVFAAATG